MHDSSSRILEQNPDVIANRLIQKAQHRDGLPEILIGLAFLILAATMWVQLVFPQGSQPYKAAIWVLGLGVPALMLSSQWIIKKVRRKFLIEKVGFVAMKPVNRKRAYIAVSIAFAIAVAAAFAAYLGRGSFPPTAWLLAGTGIGGGALMVLAGRLPRFAVGGMLMAATGIVLAFSGVSLELGFAILYGAIGLLLFVSGTTVFLILVCKPAETKE
ncbi:MAG: hypothetical protein ABSD67_00485 [Terracidiphilus sp.]|jgi:hypothetical protein